MCHRHGVMHRDLKPENFLHANKKETAPLKAIDFGLSIFFSPGIDNYFIYLSMYIHIAFCIMLLFVFIIFAHNM